MENEALAPGTPGPGVCPSPTLTEKDVDLDRLVWRNWLMIVGIVISTAVGLAAVMHPTVSARIAEIWPWEGTTAVLVGGLAMIVVLAAWHLTAQQRQVIRLRRELMVTQTGETDRMRRHCDRLFALLTVSRAIGTENDPRAIFQVISRTCHQAFGSDQVSLMLVDRESGELVVKAAHGHRDPARVVGARTRVGEGIAGWVAEHRQPAILGRSFDASRYPGFTPKSETISSSIVVPIENRGELVGVLNVSNRTDERQYDNEDLQALQVFAEHAGIVCRHAEQADWMRQTIQRLDEALMERDRQEGRQAA